jgi:hypothetical protein
MLEHGMHAPEAAAGEHGRAGRVIISRIEGWGGIATPASPLRADPAKLTTKTIC